MTPHHLSCRRTREQPSPQRASRTTYLTFCILVVGSTALGAWAAFPTIWTPWKAPGLLVPRESTLLWESPNAEGPIVAEHAELEFRLDNPGGSPVKVLGIDATCGCVKPVADPPDVKPGGMTTIILKAIRPSTGLRVMPLVVHTDSLVDPDVHLTARIIVRRKPPFLYDVTGDLTFRGAFSPKLAGELSVVTFESEGPTLEPKVATDLPFLEIGQAQVSDESAGTRNAETVGVPVIVRTRNYRVRLKELPPDPAFIGTITVTDPFGRTGSRSLNVVGQLDLPGSLRVVPRLLRLRKQEGASGSFVVICHDPSRTVTCSIDDPRRADFSINVDSDNSIRRVHKVRVAIVDPRQLSDDPVHLQVRDPHTGAEATVLLCVAP